MSASASADRQAAQARSAAAWAELRGRLATVTPAALGRALLGVVVVSAVAGFAIGTWPALLPFVIGGLLAYAILPVVDALDRVMPRSLAAVVGMLGIVAAVVAVFVVVVPPLTSAIVNLAGAVPGPDTIRASLDDVLSSLPENTKAILGPILIEIARVVADGMTSASNGIDRFLPVVFQAALGVAGAILGLIVLPAWMLTLMTGKRRGATAVDRRLAAWIRPDFWAVVRMADRAAGTYLRGFVVLAFVVGLLVYLGINLSPRLGGPTFRSDLALATFAGAVQVVPELGPILGFFPAALLLAVDPEHAVVYLAVYVAARILAGTTVGGQLLEDRLRVHPAVLIPGVVVLSQVGPLALLLSAPILSFGSDLVRYLHGRMSEPPRPAGLLPGEPLPAARATAPSRVPAIYRSSPHPAAMAAAGRPSSPTSAATTVTGWPAVPSSPPAPPR